MVSLDDIREELKKRLELDNKLHHVEVHASTVDEALADAAVQLDVRTDKLEYEVIERGSDGFLGIGKKPWKLKIYQDPETIIKKTEGAVGVASGEEGVAEEEKIEQKDGLFYVRHFGSSIKLKVLPPVNGGRPIDEKEVLDMVKRSDTESFDAELIHKFIETGTNGEYETVGTYAHISAADSLLTVDIAKDMMKVNIVVDAPAQSGSELTAEQIRVSLVNQGVRAGIDMDKINEFVDNPVYNTP